jgi:hypothetical protein
MQIHTRHILVATLVALVLLVIAAVAAHTG